jgi:hypothetical protein
MQSTGALSSRSRKKMRYSAAKENDRSTITLVAQRSYKRAGVVSRKGAHAQAVNARRSAVAKNPDRRRQWQKTAGNARRQLGEV